MDVLDMVYTTHWSDDEGEEVVDGDKVVQPNKIKSGYKKADWTGFNLSPDQVYNEDWNTSHPMDFASSLMNKKIRGINQPKLFKRLLDTTDFGEIMDEQQDIIDLNSDEGIRFTTTHKIRPKGLNPPGSSENKMEKWENRIK